MGPWPTGAAGDGEQLEEEVGRRWALPRVFWGPDLEEPGQGPGCGKQAVQGAVPSLAATLRSPWKLQS